MKKRSCNGGEGVEGLFDRIEQDEEKRSTGKGPQTRRLGAGVGKRESDPQAMSYETSKPSPNSCDPFLIEFRFVRYSCLYARLNPLNESVAMTRKRIIA